MHRLLLLLPLAGCATSGAPYITIEQDTALFCLPPEVGVVEYECTYMINAEGEKSPKVCPRGYIHRTDRPNTCRRKDMPVEKVEVGG